MDDIEEIALEQFKAAGLGSLHWNTQDNTFAILGSASVYLLVQ